MKESESPDISTLLKLVIFLFRRIFLSVKEYVIYLLLNDGKNDI